MRAGHQSRDCARDRPARAAEGPERRLGNPGPGRRALDRQVSKAKESRGSLVPARCRRAMDSLLEGLVMSAAAAALSDSL
jgi:hypothetical protein